MQKTRIRPIVPAEYSILEDFLLGAIFVPEGSPQQPDLQVYIEDFGKSDDCGFVAVRNDRIVGACWARIMHDYGHIDDHTPSFAISVLEKYRSQGIGTSLLETLCAELARKGWRRLSMSVQKANRAVNLYQRLGFKVMRENAAEYIMALDLQRD